MATYFRAKVSGRIKKQFTCAACGCVYQAMVERTVVTSGGRPEVARERAARQLTGRLKTATDLRPCPTCGLIPADAVTRRTEYVHGFIWIAAAAVAAVAAGMGGAGVISLDATAAAVGGATVLGVLLHAVTALSNPNRWRAANLERAEAEVAAGVVDLVQPGQPGAGHEPRSWTKRHSLGIALAAIAPLILILPAYLRTTMKLPLNPNLGPRLVAIGSQFTANLPPPPFQSVEGRWSGTPMVEVLNAAAIHGPKTLTATSRAEALGEKISVRQGETNRAPADLFCNITIPDDPVLDGKTLQLRAKLNIVYPYRTSQTNFERKVATVTNDFSVELSPKAHLDKFNQMSLGAMAVAAIGTLAGGGLLAWGIAALKKQAPAAEMVAQEQGVMS